VYLIYSFFSLQSTDLCVNMLNGFIANPTVPVSGNTRSSEILALFTFPILSRVLVQGLGFSPKWKARNEYKEKEGLLVSYCA